MGIKTATQINETEQNPDIHTCIYTDFQLSCQTNAVREKKTLHQIVLKPVDTLTQVTNK